MILRTVGVEVWWCDFGQESSAKICGVWTTSKPGPGILLIEQDPNILGLGTIPVQLQIKI